MLTQDGTLNITPTKRSPYGHAKSKSLSIADLENQSPHPGIGLGSSHAKVHIPASFTAKNLALPTTPTPLPMHPSQFSNTSTRRGRRITIDHDIDLLTGMSVSSYSATSSHSRFSQWTVLSIGDYWVVHDVCNARMCWLTVESESSKVNKAKAVFDSPDKEERAAIALSRKKTMRMSAYPPEMGSPIQRRP